MSQQTHARRGPDVPAATLVARIAPALFTLTALGACAPDAAVRPDPGGLLAEPVASATTQAAQTSDTIPGAYVVLFRTDVTDVPARAQQLLRDHGGTLRRAYSALKGFSATGVPASAAETFARNANVEVVAPVVTMYGGQADQNDLAAFLMPTKTRNRPPWGLDRIDQPFHPRDSAYSYGSTGRGVRIYVIDSGTIPTHPEFRDSTETVSRVTVGPNYVDDTNGGTACHGHGVHVAGTAAGRTVGVASDALITSVRVLRCDNTGEISWFTDAMDWVIANVTLPAVVNLSIWTRTPNSAVDAAARRVHNAGVPLVTIAGNRYNSSACNHSPGRVAEVITVGAIDSTDTRWDNRTSTNPDFTGSSFGTCVDLFAPGRDVRSAVPTSVPPGGMFFDPSGYRTGSGTSFAAPHVAGAVARCLETNPNLTPTQLRDAIVNRATREVIDPATRGTGSPDRLLHIAPGWPVC